MSAMGHKQTFALQQGMSALPPKAVEIADIAGPDGAEHFCSALYFKRPAPL